MQAPELDCSAIAPELCMSEGPQVHDDAFPQVAFDRRPPYALDRSQEESDRKIVTARLLQRSYTVEQILTCLGAFIVILAISLGIGLGLGLHKGNIYPADSGPSQPPSANNTNGTNGFHSGSGISILPDTSLGAVTTTDGNKHIFFQDTTRGIRQIIYYEQEQRWFSTAVLLMEFRDGSALSRNYTPMAVLSTGDAQYQLFYVDTQNFIRAIPTDHPFLWLNNSLFVASDTRTLSISPLVPAAPSTDVEVGPFYETPGGNIAGLYGSFPGGTGDNNVTWNWTDISGTLYASAANVGAGLGAPFAATISQSTYEGNSTQELQIQAFNPKQFTNSSAPVFCQFMFSWDAPAPDTPTKPSCHNDTIDRNGTDFLSLFVPSAPESATFTHAFAWVVNDTLESGFLGLTTPYPYGRLAWLNTTNTSSIHIYHQLDGYTLVEDTYVFEVGWESTNITVTIDPEPTP